MLSSLQRMFAFKTSKQTRAVLSAHSEALVPDMNVLRPAELHGLQLTTACNCNPRILQASQASAVKSRVAVATGQFGRPSRRTLHYGPQRV